MLKQVSKWNGTKTFLTVACMMGLFQSCQQESASSEDVITAEAEDVIIKDEHTQSNADSIGISHLDLDISVDFDNKQISGSAGWTIKNKFKLGTLRLDTHELSIDSVFADGKKTDFLLGKTNEVLGTPLNINILPETKKVKVYYRSGADATALKWLTPQQTAGKKSPFLYTQSEAIFARTWIPCPDGPGIRFTYSARVKVPTDLLALMSATNPQKKNDSGVYHFEMDNPIPAYLMALAVGDISFKPVDNRSGVYAEPSVIKAARYELDDMGKMIATAEQLYGPYRWSQYDVLILPPSFPIGGMENPRLTFATPTIIAGDRSLVNLIAHELAHNWSGNLVTNATWNDIWMNEGFTVYFERRITEAMNDKSYTDMLWELGYQDLEAQVAEMGDTSRDTWLKLDLEGRDPDEGLSDIPYEKGALFLKLIEETVGRDKFDTFLKQYFNEHAFKSITTEEFLSYLNDNLLHDDTTLIEKIDINAWVYGPGIPSNAPRADGIRFKKVDSVRASFLNGASVTSLNTKGWTTHEWLHFLRKMPKPLTVQQMSALDNSFHFTKTGNSEIADLWFVMAIAADYKAAYPAIDNFLSRVGRRKFLEPLYSEMMRTGKADMAKEIYQKYRQNYHPVAQGSMDKIVK